MLLQDDIPGSNLSFIKRYGTWNANTGFAAPTGLPAAKKPSTNTAVITQSKPVVKSPIGGSTWGTSGYPTVTQRQPYDGPLNKTQGPYIPGVSNNAAALGSASGNVTTNKTFFPPGPKEPEGPGPGPGPGPGGSGYVAPDNYVPPGTPSAQDILKDLGRGTNDQYQYMQNIIDGSGPFSHESKAVRPEMRGAAGTAELHGIDYNMANMRGIYDDATRAQYASLDKEHERGQGMFYRDSARMATDLNSALMRGDRSAAMTGATRGSNVAEQLAAMQGMAEAGTLTATTLGQERAGLIDKREAALADNAKKALADYNKLGIDLGTLSARELDALMLGYTGELGYDATMGSAATNANALLKGNAVNSMGHMYSADTGLAGTQYNADSNAAVARMQDSTQRANIGSNAANESSRNATNLEIAKMQLQQAGLPYDDNYIKWFMNNQDKQTAK